MPSPPRVVRYTGAGGTEVIAIEERACRAPGFGEVRVAIEASALNRADLLQRRGVYPAPPGAPADVPGLEYAGVVAELGEGVRERAVGDRVMGLAAGGAHATELVVHARETVRVPRGMSLTDAAAIPEVFATAWDALVVQAGLGSGDVALVHGAGSGVGTAALQIAKALGARALGTSRTADKLVRCVALGMDADDGIVPAAGKFADAVLARTGGAGANVILDGIGAAYLEENVRAVAPRGRIVVIGLLAGASGTLLLGALLQKRARVVGSVLRSRPLEEKIALAIELERRVVPLFESGALRPVVDEVVPMARVADAHARMEKNETFGKLVLAW